MHKHGSKLRIGIVGAGGIVKLRHLPALLDMPDVEIVAVCNSTYESAESFCAQHLPHATPIKNWADLLALPDLDIIWIGTPPYMHSAVTVSALEAKRHVFCQARMAMNLAEAEEMLAASEKHPELVTMLCPPPMGLRGDLLMRKLLAESVAGAPHAIRLQSFTSQYLEPNAPAHWRQRDELSGLNVLTLGIYAEVLQRWLGPITEVYARAKTIYPVRRGYLVRVPDQLSVLCQFESGVEGVLEFSGVAAFAPGDRLEIYGDEGTITYDFATDRIEAGNRSSPALEHYEIPAELEVAWRVEEDFIAAVKSRGQIKPSPSFEDGVRYMRVVQAVAESIESNSPIRIG